ncbi:MAG: hypothetical protein IT529_00620 [Burkholderiales bacterium]|nr:hypothetical protein [Burkholderiales bacterium]
MRYRNIIAAAALRASHCTPVGAAVIPVSRVTIEFDGAVTAFSAHVDGYVNDAAGTYSPNLLFRLFGARSIPLPASAALVPLAILPVVVRGARRVASRFRPVST